MAGVSARVKEIAESLDVSSQRLTETYDGAGTTQTPIIDYLEENETLSHILTAGVKGLAIGQKGNGQRVIQGKPTYLFTDRRIVSIMPQEGGDSVVVIPYNDVTDVENHFGFTKYRMAIQTHSEEYHLWLSASHSESEVTEASQLVSDNIIDGESGDESQEDTESVQDHLNPDEEVIFEFSADKRGMKIHENDNVTDIDKSGEDGKSKFIFTDQRLLTLIPQLYENKIFSIDLSTIIDVSLTNGRMKNRIDVYTDEKRYQFWTKNLEPTKGFLDYVYDNISRTRFALIWEGDGKGELEILDRSTGIARMETEGQTKGNSKGWNYGLDFLERTTQSHNLESSATSVIEEEAYTATIHECVISGGEVYLKADDPDGGSNAKQEIRRPFDEIGAVDSHDTGFTLFTTSGIYRLSFSEVPDEEIEQAAQYMRENIHKEPQETSEDVDFQGGTDNIEKLERLAELEEQGVISESELEEKKQQLLEDI